MTLTPPLTVNPAAINPNNYLKDLFTQLPAAKITEIGLFTPAAWIKATAKPNPVSRAA
jgi:hypothetical protein